MPSLYHMVPRTLVGTTLYPLNQLKEVHPELYEEYRKKYVGRERLFSHRIYPLDCLWNDVLFLTAVSPQELRHVHDELEIPHPLPFRFFEIDTTMLDLSKATVMLHQTRNQNLPEEYESFDVARLPHYAAIPEATREHYRECKHKGVRPLLFVHIPHILYKGTLDISCTSIIEA